jgi:selenobiotic family peptide radical SAM maturase
VTRGAIDDIIFAAIERGLILEPESKLVRARDFPRGAVTDRTPFIATTFTLQWHITQECDLHCRHCYDRSDRHPLPLEEAIGILDDLYDFCRRHHVFGQVTFTGGNPLLYLHFDDLYREAAERGFILGILGNPASRQQIEKLTAVQKPAFYQVSLEGLRQHNDFMRGQGHFDRVMDFLPLLAEFNIYSMVMLTLTRNNLDQVINLASYLSGRVDQFTFNRLAMVGEGADLASVEPSDYAKFLEDYLEACRRHPHMTLKDNLFNLVLHKSSRPLIGGCTDAGCGAAFNFAALLPDGEVHACRKFPSPIGNIRRQHLADIYWSEQAKRYRTGSSACRDCRIRPVCGSCLAVVHGFGKDVFSDLDPYCFKS